MSKPRFILSLADLVQSNMRDGVRVAAAPPNRLEHKADGPYSPLTVVEKESGGRMNVGDHPSHPDLFAAFVALGENLLAAARLLHELLVRPSPSLMGEDLKRIRSLEEASNATVRDVTRNLGFEGGSGRLSALQVTLPLRHLDDAIAVWGHRARVLPCMEERIFSKLDELESRG